LPKPQGLRSHGDESAQGVGTWDAQPAPWACCAQDAGDSWRMLMSLIGRFMPDYSLRQLDRVAVAAGPERAYETVRRIDIQRLAFARALFGLRTLPQRVLAALGGRAERRGISSRIEDITRPGSGFLLLGEEPGHEVVVGSVGKFWQPSIEFVTLTPETFRTFSWTGFGKVAWCLRVERREGGGAWIAVELRVGATDAASLSRFRRYWLLVGWFSRAIRRGLLRTVVRDLGSADEEARMVPGDRILPERRFQKTHVVTIESPPERLWPWLVQMGCRRAGWYSFDWADNGGVRSAERIVPELQHLSVGDLLPARPKGPDGFAVLQLEPSRSLVLGSPSPLPGGSASGGPPWRTTWAFRLEPIGDEATQLTVRVRADFRPGLKMAVIRPVMAAVHGLMERRQLENLRKRAEAGVRI